jgi:hypothetical protein
VVSARASGGALGAPLSTADVDGLLTRHADGDAAALPTALQRVGPLEAKWLVRLFLRDLKIQKTGSWGSSGQLPHHLYRSRAPR